MSNELPEGFWAQNFEEMGLDTPLQLIYAEACSRLRQENAHADTLELMLIERVAFLYVYIRHKETKKAFAHDRAHKETFQLWATMAASLRKHRDRTEDAEYLREQILDSVEQAIAKAVAKLDPEVRKTVEATLLTELDEVGL